ncbi:AT-rich interactive domain-containing protein 4A isoform III [Homo sapiens]|uniref:Isoform III of AT-rich interactive domain-containing protein 4A n=1 Tax=Homo sapiens TaxID=9606 RepID=P29374-3|nr:AT-rich interactive domain-containing protein 4A isoform III [Homo sapiens]AAI72363.1 AT rich interactive domain 4A (RBP1-like) [synthetic construct]EAW80728.1 AT rich interactive domain 4A (RBP1-like), isoform CRA_b [Homo sapiens]EAW80729.1 AT rich interactive domain 4A (RBP1-like), isoform CRA_b [Homo sapiens]KAI2571411.1 AT-rich interaction domain 4A [Homo sapiens]KAI2571412.1 AT-rich interaction domain 4A [Homo sapiens]|eukprot:NP_075377.2 AT-rich interactive domain-containing protein 4A isoform III [Homo sapiens]
MKAADEPAYLTVGTDVSAKYRGAFCEAKIKTVKRLVKVKVLLKQDNTTQLVQDDQVKGPLRVGAIVETRTSDGSFQEAIISKLTDASWYTVVFDDGDERTLRRTSLCLKGERHFAESETLDQLPLTNPEHFGTPVIAKKTNRGRRSSLPVTEDEKEEESSEEEDEDKRRLNDELLGKVVSVVSATERTEWYPALVISPSCNDDITVKKDQCLVRSFIDSKFYSIARKDIKEVDILNLPESELSTKPGLQKASIFLKTRVVPDNWKMDISEILESSSSDDEDGPAEENDEEKEKEAKKTEEEVPEEELDPEERDNFLQQLYKFMEDRGTPINKPPVLGYKDLNLFKLFRLVYHQGGCDNIDSGAVWKQIYMDLGIPILNSAASYNVKTAYRKYLYGFEEYCRSANIQFRTVHHHEPKVKEEKKDLEESMEEALKLDQEMPLTEVKSEPEENIDSNSESEREEIELKSPRGRRRIARDVNSIKKEIEEEKTEDKLKDNDTENKDVDDDYETAEKKENELLLGRKNTPKQKEKKIKKQEDSDKDSDEEEEKSQEREETESKCDSEGEEDEEDMEPCLTGTKVKVKYGRGKTQKIYEASIKSTEIDDGEVLYLVHYYGWNVRYDEWVKADRIIWPLDKGGPKKKQKKKAKNKEDSEKDEKRDEERQKSKRGRPPLKSTLSSNMPYGLSKTANSEGKSDSCSSDSETEDALEKNLINEELSLKDELEKNENLNDDKLDEENPKISAHILKENDRTQMQPLETLKLEVGENEQIVQIFGNKMEKTEEVKKEAEKSPKGKGRRSKTKDLSLEIIKISSFGQNEAGSEPHIEAHSLELSSLDNKNFSSATEDEIDQCVKEKKLKRKILGQSSPEKKIRIENGMEMTNTVSQERTSDCIGSEGMKNLNFEQHFERENEGMPSLIAESNQCIQQLTSERFDSPAEETVNIPLKEDEDAMPLIGPETLVCHEVDLDDLDEKDKTSIEDVAVESSESNSLVSIPPALPPVVQHNFSVASPLTLSQDESRSVKSESDITIEVDSIAEESQEGLCERESANGFETNVASGTCSIIVQERESREKGQKRPSDGNSGLMAKKQKRTPKRTSAAAKNEKNGTDELDNMNSTERISFLQEKLQEIRKYYMSLKSEVATIDRRRKRLKKKDREVSHAGASMSSASSDTGMSPSSSSPPQNVLAVECR